MKMIDPFSALGLILERSKTAGTEVVSIFDSLNRVVSEKLQSAKCLPPKDNSAMDGFAVKYNDIATIPATLKVKGGIKAGESIDGLELGKGECFRIMTGAFVPAGADTVVELEATEDCGENTVKIISGKKAGANIRRKGEDIERGDYIGMIGFPLNAFGQSRLISAGVSFVPVYRKPKVAIIATGDELEYPASGNSEYKTIDSNSFFIKSTLEDMGIRAEYIGIVKDDAESLINVFSKLVNYDVIVTSAGISFGDYDVVSNASDRLGIEWLFESVNQKPGKPFSFAELGNTLIFSFPGNPVSSAFCTYFYLKPALRKMMGCKVFHNRHITAELRGSFIKRKKRVHFNRVKVVYEDGKFYAIPYESQDSHLIFSLVESNGFAVVNSEETGKIPSGSLCKVYLYDFESIF